MPIYISEDAFITLTLSAIETSTNYEASGLLLGYKSEGMYYVQNTIPYQLAERSVNSVSVSKSKQSRIQRVFGNYMRYKIIGEFHTHSDGSTNLSEGDIDYIRSRGYNLEIVIAIRKDDLNNPWSYEKGVLSGSIDKYFIEICCWRVERNKTVKLKLRCPFAVGFDFVPPIK
jgi:proteasome lid subunit RPN8/RPN11